MDGAIAKTLFQFGKIMGGWVALHVAGVFFMDFQDLSMKPKVQKELMKGLMVEHSVPELWKMKLGGGHHGLSPVKLT